jgi:Transposase (partial DDE domain)
LFAAWGDQAPSDRTVLNWFHQFRRGNFSLQDDPRCGRPRTSVNEEMIDAVRAIIEGDPHSTYQQMETTLGISPSSVNSIIQDHLHLRKVRTRWVPHCLTDDQKSLRIESCHQTLKRFEGGRSRRVFDIVTIDESWLYYFNPGTKQQSTVWISKNEARPTKVRRARSTGKRMVAIFFMKSGLIKSIALESGATVNADCYTNLCLPEVLKTVSERRLKTGIRGFILHDDNARLHRVWITNEFLF